MATAGDMRHTVSLKLDKEAGEIVGWEKFWEVLDTDKGLSNEIKKDLKDNLQTLSIKLENHQDEFFKMAIKAISEIENSDSSPWV